MAHPDNIEILANISRIEYGVLADIRVSALVVYDMHGGGKVFLNRQTCETLNGRVDCEYIDIKFENDILCLRFRQDEDENDNDLVSEEQATIINGEEYWFWDLDFEE
jgi:hypothetical protein